jgi:phosphoglycerate dehydrogenase-like enzyme
MLPPKDELTICFAHVAYRLRERFLRIATGIESFEVRDGAALERQADVLVISGLWRNDLLPRAKRLRFIQSIGTGTDQFSREALKQHGVRLASARGVNARTVSEHVMALMLALSRRLPEARDNQAKRVWRGMISDLTQREDELGGKTLLIVGLGQIGGRLAWLAMAFDNARDRHPPRPARRRRTRGCGARDVRPRRVVAAGRFRCPHLPADGGNLGSSSYETSTKSMT